MGEKPLEWDERPTLNDPKDKKPADWEVPLQDNPKYIVEWKAKQLPNPAYKGIWEARKLANPAYAPNNELYRYDDFGFIGFDLWQVRGGAIFDNIIITDEKAKADAFAEKWREHKDAEERIGEKERETRK